MRRNVNASYIICIENHLTSCYIFIKNKINDHRNITKFQDFLKANSYTLHLYMINGYEVTSRFGTIICRLHK